MIGENLVYLRGYLKNIECSHVGDHNNLLYKAKLAIPTQFGFQYLRVSSFDCAEALSNLKEDTAVFIVGHIEDKSFTVKCKHCGGYDKRAWFEVIIDNFNVVKEGD